MTDFFKNNTIALRHCLLYEFLQAKSFKTTYREFCAAVGKNIIDKEEFWCWLEEFKYGMREETETNVTDILRYDKYALRVCVFYESLKYRAECFQSLSFPKYNNFCKAIGKNAMEFREFDFLFHRFLNGEFDLNCEMDKDKRIYELTDMPIDIMKEIMEYLNVFDRFSLMKTSRSFRTFTEDQKLFVKSLELDVDEDTLRIKFDEKTCTKRIQGVSEWKQATMDFKSVLKSTKLRLDSLAIDVTHERTSSLELLLDFFQDKEYLHVKEIFAFSLEPLFTILPRLKPGYLTKIDISLRFPKYEDLRGLGEMEQWKQAKILFMDNVYNDDAFRHLRHFQAFDITHRTWETEDIRQTKEFLCNSPNFQECLIKFTRPIDIPTVRAEFGDAIPGTPNIYHYPIPNTTQYFQIVVLETEILIMRMEI